MNISVPGAALAGLGLACGFTLATWGVSRIEGISATAALKSLKPTVKPKLAPAKATGVKVVAPARLLNEDSVAAGQRYLATFPSWWFGE